MIQDILIEARREPLRTACEMLVVIGMVSSPMWIHWFVAVVAVVTGLDGMR